MSYQNGESPTAGGPGASEKTEKSSLSTTDMPASGSSQVVRLPSSMTKVQRAILAYLNAGRSVLPCTIPGKKPSIPTWTHLQAAPATWKEVRTWTEGNAVAIIGGRVSGNVECIDFDAKGAAFEPWKALVEAERPGLLARLTIEQTPSGGFHVVYACPDVAELPTQDLATRPHECPDASPIDVGGKTLTPRKYGEAWVALEVLIETRAEGAYFICAPSAGYALVQGNMREMAAISPEEREALLHAARMLDEWAAPTTSQEEGQVWDPARRDRPGDDFNTRPDPEPYDMLVELGGEPCGSGGAYEYFTRPGKAGGASGSLIGGRVFRCFSTNWPPFEAGVNYSPFSLYALAYHNGDHKAASKELRVKGFGVPEDPATAFNNAPLAEVLAAMPPMPGPAAEGQQAAAPGRGFRFLSLDELTAAPTIPKWLVRDYLECETLAEIFGEAGSMKSFVALDLSLCIASGRAWHGHECPNPGAVFFLAGEGFHGLAKRVQAWKVAHGIREALPFFVSSAPAQLLDAGQVGEVERAVAALAAVHGAPRLLIIDTLNRNFGPGDENSSADMSAFVAALDRLKARFRCAVLVVHHSGLTARDRSRGSSVLRAALDFEFKLEAKDGARILTNTKTKDHEPPQKLAFVPHDVGTGWTDPETGQEITSCVMRLTASVKCEGPARPTGAKGVALEALEVIHGQSGKPVHVELWREAAYGRGISTGTASAKRKAFGRAVEELRDSGHAVAAGEDLWIPSGYEWGTRGT